MSETLRSGVIINPRAGRGNGKGMALAKALPEEMQAAVKVIDAFDALKPALQELAAQHVTTLFLSSGDGTIQAVQSLLAEEKIFSVMPRLCILKHGTTNLTGIDVGLREKNISAQAAFISRLGSGHVKRRRSLRVTNARDGRVRHGMTLGAGAAARATRLTQTDFNDKGKYGQLAAARMLSRAVVKALLTQPRIGDRTRLDHPCQMEITNAGKPIANGPQLMFIATSLEKQFFNTRPFWGGSHGPIRGTVFPHPAPNLLRWMLPLMYGGENRKVPAGCISFSTMRFEIICAEPFVMDGEFFDGPDQGALIVEAGPEFEFVVA